MKATKELRISDLQTIRGAVGPSDHETAYSKNVEDGAAKSSEVVKEKSAVATPGR